VNAWNAASELWKKTESPVVSRVLVAATVAPAARRAAKVRVLGTQRRAAQGAFVEHGEAVHAVALARTSSRFVHCVHRFIVARAATLARDSRGVRVSCEKCPKVMGENSDEAGIDAHWGTYRWWRRTRTQRRDPGHWPVGLSRRPRTDRHRERLGGTRGRVRRS